MRSLLNICSLIMLTFVLYTNGLLKWEKIIPEGDIPTNITKGVAESDHDNSIYLIGGHRELWLPTGVNITFYDTVYKYSISNNYWTLLDVVGDKPSPRVYAAGTWSDYDNKIYLYGGAIFTNEYIITNLYNDLWSYDPSTLLFTKINTTNLGPNTRAGSELYQKGSKLFLTSGIYDLQFGVLPIYANDIWYLDLSLTNKTWVLINTTVSPPSRSFFQKFQVLNKLYLYGGNIFDLTTLEFKYLDDTWEFDVVTMTWTEKHVHLVPPGRIHASSFSFGFFNWVIYGGEVIGNQQDGCFAPNPQNSGNDTWVYSTVLKTWTRIHPRGDYPPPIKRHYGVNVKLLTSYIFSGFSFYCTETDQRGQVYNNDFYKLSFGFDFFPK